MHFHPMQDPHTRMLVAYAVLITGIMLALWGGWYVRRFNQHLDVENQRMRATLRAEGVQEDGDRSFQHEGHVPQN